MLNSIRKKIARGLAYRKEFPYLLRVLAYVIFFTEKKSKNFPNKAQLKRLLRDGMTLLPGENLLPATVVSLRSELEKMRYVTKTDENNNILKKIYEPADLVKNPDFLKLSLRDEVLDLAENYLQCTPKIAYLAAWTVYADSIEDVGEMSFHRIKRYIYISIY